VQSHLLIRAPSVSKAIKTWRFDKVNFKEFSRSSKETEYLNYKSMLDHQFKGCQQSPKDSAEDLIMLIDRLVNPV
jgi:hypothetical protein